jgi:hypothetical protein
LGARGIGRPIVEMVHQFEPGIPVPFFFRRYESYLEVAMFLVVIQSYQRAASQKVLKNLKKNHF